MPLKEQIANFKIPNHGVEFYFDRKTMEWENRNTDSGEFKLTTLNGIIIPLPNFYKTFPTSQAMTNGIEEFRETEEYYGSPMDFQITLERDKLVPTVLFGRVDGHRRDSIQCNIFTGEWSMYFLEIETREKIKAIDMDDQNKRLAKLEYLFQRVREKSSILDEFLRISEEVEKETCI